MGSNPIPGAIFKGNFEAILAKGAYLLVISKLTRDGAKIGKQFYW
jgi:hypothetical protein